MFSSKLVVRWATSLAAVMVVGVATNAGAAPPPKKPKPSPSTSPSPTSSPTAAVRYSAPYAGSDGGFRCQRGALTQVHEVCWGRGAEFPESGEMWNSIELRSPGNGSVPQGPANTLDTFSELRVDANLSQSANSLPVHALFDVDAAASLSGVMAGGSRAASSLTLEAGQTNVTKIVVDADPNTPAPDEFEGPVVLTATIPAASAGALTINAGIFASASIPTGDIASAFTDISAKLRFVQLGGEPPTPTPPPAPTGTRTYTAPFAGVAEGTNVRYDAVGGTGWNPVEGAATFDKSGEFAFDLDALGAAPATYGGWHEGRATLTLPQSVPRGADVRVKAVWEVDSFSTLHSPCPVFHACNVGLLESFLVLEDKDGWVLPAGGEDGGTADTWKTVFFDGNQSFRDRSATVELVVTAADVHTSDIVIVTAMEGFVEGEVGYGELQSWGRLKSITVETL